MKYAVQKDVVIGSSTEEQVNYDLLNVVMVNLGSEAQQAAGSLLTLLTVLFASPKTLEEKKFIISNEFDIKINSDMEHEVDEMCNLSDGVYETGKAKGQAEGEAKVHKETALEMLKDKKPLNEIIKYSTLAKEAVFALDKENGLEVVVG